MDGLLDIDQLGKAHIQLGHATEASMIRLLKLAREQFYLSRLHRLVEERPCRLSRPSAGSSVANIHCALYPGHSIAIDV